MGKWEGESPSKGLRDSDSPKNYVHDIIIILILEFMSLSNVTSSNDLKSFHK